MYRSAVLLLLLDVKMAMFFLCTVEHHSIIKLGFFWHTFESYKKEIGKPDESTKCMSYTEPQALNSNKWQRIR